ncbi:MAG: substrate-binding domain-containing protein [Aggregatilineales bacterium]
MITDEVITTPYAVDIISGAQDALWVQGRVMLVVNAAYGIAMTEASLEALLERRVEGIIYATMFHREVELTSQMSKVPIVLANCFSKDREYPSVVPDEFGGGYAATNLLLRKGHTRIGFINLGTPVNGRPPLAAASGRLAGYKKALDEYNVPYDGLLVKYTNQTPQAVVQLTKELMSLSNPPTAIFCGNDRAAMGCYSALASMQLRIPYDVAVVGFDNQTSIAENLWPPLTTVQLPHYEMGKWAVEYLASGIETPHTPVQRLAECPLVERESA